MIDEDRVLKALLALNESVVVILAVYEYAIGNTLLLFIFIPFSLVVAVLSITEACVIWAIFEKISAVFL